MQRGCPVCKTSAGIDGSSSFQVSVHSSRNWKEVFIGLNLHVDRACWHSFHTVKTWWEGVINHAQQKKVLSSLLGGRSGKKEMSVSLEIRCAGGGGGSHY
jgi:hypothetical protein